MADDQTEGPQRAPDFVPANQQGPYEQTRPELAHRGVQYDANGAQINPRYVDRKNAKRNRVGEFAIGHDDDVI